MANNPTHLIPCDVVVRSFRDLPPAHYIIKIDSFSHLLSKTGAKIYESKSFEASGHKWKLHLYPNGDKERNGKGYISMYLVMQDTKDMPLGWEVNVNFKLFVFEQNRGKYLAIQDSTGTRRFDEMKIEWGFPQLLTNDEFHDASNGYLVHDKCVFGAEIFVISRTGKGERQTASLLQDGTDCRHTWKIDKFSTLDNEILYSDIFTMGNFKWKLELYPNGHSTAAGNSISIFLMIVDLKRLESVDVEYTLRIKNQNGNIDKEYDTVHNQFTKSDAAWGYREFLPLSVLKDTSKGFLVNDSLIVEVQITKMLVVESFS